MSIKYRLNNGTEINVAGLTPGGNLEAGAVATRKGTITTSNIEAGEMTAVTVTFSDPMPDADYEILFHNTSDCSMGRIGTQTANGFTVTVRNNASSVQPCNLDYYAFKTYSVQHAAQNAADIAEIKSSIPAGASSSNKLVTTTQFNNTVNPLTESVEDIQDVVPADASITNKLVSQETLDNTLEEANEAIWKVMGKNGAKNLNSYPYAYTTREVNGITFTDNGDGTVTANGTATADAQFNFHERTISGENKLILNNGNYIISGCPEGGSTSKYYINANMTKDGAPTVLGTDIGSGAEITVNGDDFSQDNVHLGLFVKIKSGQAVSNLVFKPMVRYAEDTDSTWQPYAPTNQEFVKHEDNIWKAHNILGAKNLLPYPYTNTNRTVNNVTYIDNKDGTVTVNGTASAATAFGLLRNINDNRFAGMRLSGGVNENLYVRARVGDKETDAYINQVIDTGNGCIIPEIDVSTQVIRFEYIITNGTTANNITLYPMIYLASDVDNTWKPYTKTNQELSKEQYTINMNNVLGAKNILEYPYYDTTKSSGSLVLTDLGDGTININGSHTAVVWFWFILDGGIKKGTYRLSSNIPLPAGVRLALLNHLSTDTYYANVAEGDTEQYFEIPEDINGTVRAGIRIEKDTQVDNINIRPMLRLGDDNDNTWQPYTMTNKQLTEAVYDTGWILVSGSGVNRYRKIGNIVYVHARYNMTQNTTEEIIFTLPEGYKPAFDMMFQPATNNPATYAEAYIKPSGEVCFYGTGCVGIHFMLDCSFPI